MVIRLFLPAVALALALTAAAADPGTPIPALGLEAEDFSIARGWRVVRNGEGNYCADIIGFSHISGERFLGAEAADTNALATCTFTVPAAGAYRLWIRYEYMPFTETRFRVAVSQNGRELASTVAGRRDNPRLAFGQLTPAAQYDPPWGNEGLVEESLDLPALSAGEARLTLQTVEQPLVPGRTARRFVDCFYLTADLTDGWRKGYPGNSLYPILDAVREAVGPRYEVQYTNQGTNPLTIAASQVYNRTPWNRHDPAAGVAQLPPGSASAWLPLACQDTAHFSLMRFSPSQPQPFTVSVRPLGSAAPEETAESAGEWTGIFLPPYPGKGETAITAIKAQERILAALRMNPAPGVTPSLALAYGGYWSPMNADTPYCRNYAHMHAALGMRNITATDPVTLRNLKEAGIPLNRSVVHQEYRCPPTPANIARVRKEHEADGSLPWLRWYDYGDEIAFEEWVRLIAPDPAAGIPPLWRKWLAENRSGFRPEDYWRPAWGDFNPAALRPDSSSAAAAEKPRLYVDSLIFYEDTAIAAAAQGLKRIKAAFGPDVYGGANYSCYPFYYPSTTMYVKWFRGGAADMGRQSEYFWQLGQVTPLINGYVAELFRAGMRNNPKAVVRQYTMPHSPGNTDGDFRRTAFTHLAHGCKLLDYFGIGMNETFTENYIDFRDLSRYVAVRDVNYAMALAGEALAESHVVPSPVALLVSESTERWDFAGAARDFASHDYGAGSFRRIRLLFHQERVGLYSALTFAGFSPDLLVESDLQPSVLKGYRVLILAGDCIPPESRPALERWVKSGGILLATSGVGRYGSYREPNPDFQSFLGLASRHIDTRDTFIRTSQELPFLQPLGAIREKSGAWSFPVLAARETIQPAPGTEILAVHSDDSSAAVLSYKLGKGRIIYVAALPGLAYLYKGLTTPEPVVPDRSIGAHRSITDYDAAAAALILAPIRQAGLTPRVKTEPDYIDTRLLAAPGCLILPLANYNGLINQPVKIIVQPPEGTGKPTGAQSAFYGKLEVKTGPDGWTLLLPRLGYGDLIRIDCR